MHFAKEKNRYFEWYKKLVYAGPKHFDKLELEPGPTRKARPDLQLCANSEKLILHLPSVEHLSTCGCEYLSK